VQTPPSTAKRSLAEPANATVEPCQRHGTATPTRSQEGVHEKPVGIVDGSTTPTGPSVGVALGWEAGAYERDRAALARDSAARPPLADSKARLLAMAAATEAAHAMESAGVAVALPPPVTRTTPAAADPPPKRRLPRAQWMKREAQRESLLERSSRPRRATQELPPTAAVFGALLVKHRVQVLAKHRPIMEQPAAAKRAYDRLRSNIHTKFKAAEFKRFCDEHGWTLADECARRRLNAIVVADELATFGCWNARHVRRRTRRGLATLQRASNGTAPKCSPVVRGVSQSYWAKSFAGPGHTPADDRSVHRKTVDRVWDDVAEMGLAQVIQVPAYAAEPWEIGDSGHAMNRYWLADQASPKPALMQVFTPKRAAAVEVILSEPWRGAVPTNATAPP
jgi:hypothetical protein